MKTVGWKCLGKLANPSTVGPPPRADCQNSFVTPQKSLCFSIHLCYAPSLGAKLSKVKCVVV